MLKIELNYSHFLLIIYLKGFNDKFILPFINEIEGNYERICVEMGLDENTNFFITNNGGQVNIARDESTIKATQNNYSHFDKLVNEIKDNIDSIKDFDNIKYISLVDMKNQLKEDASLTPNLLLADIIRSHYNE